MPPTARRVKHRWSKQRSLRWLRSFGKAARTGKRSWPWSLALFAALVIFLFVLELRIWEAEPASLASAIRGLFLSPVLWMILVFDVWHGYTVLVPDRNFLRAYVGNRERLCPDPDVEAEAQRMFEVFRAQSRRPLKLEHLPPIVSAVSETVAAR